MGDMWDLRSTYKVQVSDLGDMWDIRGIVKAWVNLSDMSDMCDFSGTFKGKRYGRYVIFQRHTQSLRQ